MSDVWISAVFSLLFMVPLASAQTPEIQAQLEAQRHALRTAGPLVLSGPAAAVFNEEATVSALAALIDRRLEVFWAKNGIKPSEVTDDAEFLRRVSLDLIGRIPSVQEVRRFVRGTDPRKRAAKVAELLNRAAFLNHFSTVLRQQWVPQSMDNQELLFVGSQFEAWLRGRLRENAGMDAIVRDVLTAPTLFARNKNGMIPQEELNKSAFAFNRANEFKPENVASSASRLFMGVKMECAQCHDHPFAPISRDQFWETAAFFAELQPAIANSADPRVKREIKIQDPNPKKVKTVQARFFDDKEPDWKGDPGPREVFVNWLVAPENKYFARNAVQRMWAHFFGIGFIDPIDEPGAENAELVPELVNELARAFADSRFDNRLLIKAITRTRAYQLSSRQTDPSQASSRHFARMNIKAMTAEQIYDSLLQATGISEDSSEKQVQRFQGVGGSRGEFLTKFASTEKITERQTSILQALTLMNGKFVNNQTSLASSQYLAAIADAPFLDDGAKLEALFLASLSRLPSALESERFGSYLQRSRTEGDASKALSDIFWALLNSSEFILNH